MAAANGRFGTMAAVIPQTILCEIERYSPAASSVEAATAPSRWDVRGNVGQNVHNCKFYGLKTNILSAHGKAENRIE